VPLGGAPVADPLTVREPLIVPEPLRVPDGVALGLCEGVTDDETDDVPDSEEPEDAVPVGVLVPLGSAPVADPLAVREPLIVPELLRVPDGVALELCEGTPVLEGEEPDDGVPVSEPVPLRGAPVADPLTMREPLVVPELLRVPDGVALGLREGVLVLDGEEQDVAAPVGVPVPLGDAPVADPLTVREREPLVVPELLRDGDRDGVAVEDADAPAEGVAEHDASAARPVAEQHAKVVHSTGASDARGQYEPAGQGTAAALTWMPALVVEESEYSCTTAGAP